MGLSNMATKKLSETPIASVDVKEYLATRDDFAMELLICRMTLASGFQVTHGGTYVDPVTDKPRQYDVRAEIELDGRVLGLAIECKSLGVDYPLVVSRVPRTKFESQMSYVMPVSPSLVATQLLPAKELKVSPHMLYPEGEGVGRSMTQVGRSLQSNELVGGDPDVYDKWTQALASAADLIAGAVRAGSFNAVLPVLVVSDKTLWVADYDANGVLKGDPVQIDECEYFVGRKYETGSPLPFRFTVSHLHICTLSGLKLFLYRLSRAERLFPLEQMKAAFLKDKAEC
jgi:hypothetical protein